MNWGCLKLEHFERKRGCTGASFGISKFAGRKIVLLSGPPDLFHV